MRRRIGGREVVRSGGRGSAEEDGEEGGRKVVRRRFERKEGGRQ